MSETAGRVLDYIGYKNKISALEWAERLWQQHLHGTPADMRLEEDRQRYGELLERIAEARSLAETLHRKRATSVSRSLDWTDIAEPNAAPVIVTRSIPLHKREPILRKA